MIRLSAYRTLLPLLLVTLTVAAGCSRRRPGLLDPSPRLLTAPAPDSFLVSFNTTKGRFTVVAHRRWAPNGVDRFYYLAKAGYYDSTAFYRVLRGYVAQFGFHGDPRVSAAWRERKIPDDPLGRASNTRGRMSYASAGPNTRADQLFINLQDNTRLDTLGTGYPPIAEVREGMSVVMQLYSGYGEGAPSGRGPNQLQIAQEGNAYLRRQFPQLDWILQTRVEREWK